MLDELAALIGRPGALALCAVWGGRRLYIGNAPSPALLELLGALQAAKLIARYAGSSIDVPAPPVAAARAVEAKALRAQLLTVREIAEALAVTERTVWRLLAP